MQVDRGSRKSRGSTLFFSHAVRSQCQLVSNWVLGKIGWEYRGESLIKFDHRGLILNDIFWLNLLAENTTHKLEHTRIRVPDLQAYKYLINSLFVGGDGGCIPSGQWLSVICCKQTNSRPISINEHNKRRLSAK